MAHARYFNAPDLYKLYSGSGATLAGPFYAAARNLGDEDEKVIFWYSSIGKSWEIYDIYGNSMGYETDYL